MAQFSSRFNLVISIFSIYLFRKNSMRKSEKSIYGYMEKSYFNNISHPLFSGEGLIPIISKIHFLYLNFLEYYLYLATVQDVISICIIYSPN